MSNQNWWNEKYDFFGKFYLEGDNSKEGHLSKRKLTLRQRTDKEVRGLVSLLKLKNGAEIFDVPCGYGRHSIQLAKMGFKITGLDINSVHLRKARNDTKAQMQKISFLKKDMRKISYHNKFDALINMFYSFGFFASDKENELVLQKFYNCLKPGGKFLMHTDVNIPRILNGKYKEIETRTLSSGKKLKIVDRYDSNTKRIEGSWTIIPKKGRLVKKNYSVRVYQKNEFVKLCLKVGFKKCRAYENWNGSKYSQDSEEIIFIATK